MTASPLNIGVLGTGVVGRTLASGLAELGHRVTLGTRDPEATRARGASDETATWVAAHPDIALATFSDAVERSEILINALGGTTSLPVLESLPLGGRVLVDVANPLDFSGGFPPSLTVANTDSLAEQIQRAHPETKVVKALNTLPVELMTSPAAAAGPITTFVAGDDADARARVRGLLEDLGHEDVVEFGSVTDARALEMFLPLWVRLWGTTGDRRVAIKVVRAAETV